MIPWGLPAMNLAKRVRDCRYVKGWGPDELANRAEISRTALYQIECGKTGLPRAGTLRRIAQALDVSVDQLLREEAAPPRLHAHVEDFEDLASLESPLDPSSQRPQTESDQPLPSMIRRAPTSREFELTGKLRELLDSPFGESIARIVLESHRMLVEGTGYRGI